MNCEIASSIKTLTDVATKPASQKTTEAVSDTVLIPKRTVLAIPKVPVTQARTLK